MPDLTRLGFGQLGARLDEVILSRLQPVVGRLQLGQGSGHPVGLFDHHLAEHPNEQPLGRFARAGRDRARRRGSRRPRGDPLTESRA